MRESQLEEKFFSVQFTTIPKHVVHSALAREMFIACKEGLQKKAGREQKATTLRNSLADFDYP